GRGADRVSAERTGGGADRVSAKRTGLWSGGGAGGGDPGHGRGGAGGLPDDEVGRQQQGRHRFPGPGPATDGPPAVRGRAGQQNLHGFPPGGVGGGGDGGEPDDLGLG